MIIVYQTPICEIFRKLLTDMVLIDKFKGKCISYIYERNLTQATIFMPPSGLKFQFFYFFTETHAYTHYSQILTHHTTHMRRHAQICMRMHIHTYTRTHTCRFTQICMIACRRTHVPFSFEFCFDNI